MSVSTEYCHLKSQCLCAVVVTLIFDGIPQIIGQWYQIAAPRLPTDISSAVDNSIYFDSGHKSSPNSESLRVNQLLNICIRKYMQMQHVCLFKYGAGGTFLLQNPFAIFTHILQYYQQCRYIFYDCSSVYATIFIQRKDNHNFYSGQIGSEPNRTAVSIHEPYRDLIHCLKKKFNRTKSDNRYGSIQPTTTLFYFLLVPSNKITIHRLKNTLCKIHEYWYIGPWQRYSLKPH